MISIQPKWVEKILNGEKTIEIRKTMPKCEFPIDAYIYCTQAKPYLKDFKFINEYTETRFYLDNKQDEVNSLNGKVVAKFTLNKIDKYDVDRPIYYQNSIRKNGKYIGELQSTELEILNDSWLTNEELENYLTDKSDDIADKFYAWHIENLEIFDKAKELREFLVNAKRDEHWVGHKYLRLNKAPQSWCYCEVEQ